MNQVHHLPNVANRRALIFTVLLVSALVCASALAQPHWPQEITAEEGTIVVYQPQPEKLEGNQLSGRAAISIEPADGGEPVFGAMWFSARLDTDHDSATVSVRDVRVTRVAWPDSKDTGEQRFMSLVEGSVPDAGFEISMERLSASLESAQVERESLEQIKNEPPKIIFRDKLAVLLLYDGQPRFTDIENTGYERAANTPFAVARAKRSGTSYLSSGKFWYQASDPLGPWTPTGNPPADLVEMMKQAAASGGGDQVEDDGGPAEPPEIVVATEPTELVSTQGQAEWTPLTSGDILYVKNTETAWLRELSTGNMYVLLSGRWYRSDSEDGPWTFVRADKLPESFRNIPPASDIGGLRTSVAGTPEAEDAMTDAAIPQTAAIDRQSATLEVTYDGKPEFEKIDGTDVSYAVNTASQVLKINDSYYAVDNGVWFVAPTPNGRWVVADSIPDDEIDKIPPSSPVYNTTYVNVYESTPEVVYVGYTPGYLWSFPYYGVPIYGTGWYYPPYWGPGIYYPRTPTWGFHVGYNPWTGWNFGMSWSNGFFSFGIGWSEHPCCGGWYGGGYRGPTFINTGDINIGNNINIGNRAEISNRIGNQIGDRVGGGDKLDGSRLQNRNVYNRPENRARKAEPAIARQNLQRARPATDRANNVFADRNGNVARISGNDWQTRQNGSWNSPGVRPSTRETSRGSRDFNRPSVDYGGLNRSNFARQRGSMRESSFGGHRSMPRRGGGIRRR